ncbi:MAG: hypothetical protein Q4C87_01715 [Actinomycetaceae bacterium]|nr:hypothetical protein [Actinomycetaceae bacterium]
MEQINRVEPRPRYWNRRGRGTYFRGITTGRRARSVNPAATEQVDTGPAQAGTDLAQVDIGPD